MKRTIKTVLAVTLAIHATASNAIDVKELLKGIEKAAKEKSAKQAPAPASPNSPLLESYCDRFQNNETIKAYVALGVKAKASGTSWPYGGYLDTLDGQIAQWVKNKVTSENQSSAEVAQTLLRYNQTVNACAYQLLQTDYIHFFEPYRATALLERMSKPETQGATPNYLALPNSLDDLQGQQPALYAIALDGGAEMVDKLAGEVPAKLSAAVDAEIQRDAKQRADNTAEQKRVADEKQAILDAALKRKAEDGTPDGQLLKAYTMFYRVEQCHKARQDYAAIYISSSELVDARGSVKKIETTLKTKVRTPLSQLWAQATRSTRTYTDLDEIVTLPQIDITQYEFSKGRAHCQDSLQMLKSLQGKVLVQWFQPRNFNGS